MTKIILLSISLLTMFPVSSCGPSIEERRVHLNPVNSFHVSEDIRQDKNYKINKIHNAYVGEPIVRKKSFLNKTRSELVGKPLMDLSMVSGRIVINLRRGQDYPVTNLVNIGGRKYHVLEKYYKQEDHMLGLLLDEDGRLYHKVLNGDVFVNGNFEVSPLIAEVKIHHRKTLISSKMLENFEIIFGGINSNQMNFTYREFTPEDVAKTAFFQNLTYPVGSDVIRFKTLKIKVHDVGSESITYEVIEE